MGSNKEALEAAREAVRLARKATARPWWVTRTLRSLARAPRVAWRFSVDVLEETAGGLFEVVVVLVPLGLLVALTLLARWVWGS